MRRKLAILGELMEPHAAIKNNRLFLRLICLWILSEAFLGGIIHGLKLPVSGLLVGGAATVCICLIAWHIPQKGAILKATVAVAIFKMMLSPHSPPAAYVAVFFQGILGELLLKNRRLFALLSIAFGILTMTESAIQRILILTLLYGTEFWKAFDLFVLKVTGASSVQQFSIGLAAGYVAFHVIAGISIGWLVWRLIQKKSTHPDAQWLIQIPANLSLTTDLPADSKPGNRLKAGLFVVWAFLVGLYVQSYFNPESAWLPTHVVVHILARSILILLCWYLIFSPLLMRWLHGWLEKRKEASSSFIAELLLMLPQVQFLVWESWLVSKSKKGVQRILLFSKILMVNILN